MNENAHDSDSGTKKQGVLQRLFAGFRRLFTAKVEYWPVFLKESEALTDEDREKIRGVLKDVAARKKMIVFAKGDMEKERRNKMASANIALNGGILRRFGDYFIDLTRVWDVRDGCLLLKGDERWYGVGEEVADAVRKAITAHPSCGERRPGTCDRAQVSRPGPSSHPASCREESFSEVQVQLPNPSLAITSFPARGSVMGGMVADAGPESKTE